MSIKSKIKKSFLFSIYSFFTVKESIDSVFLNKIGVSAIRILLAEIFRKVQSVMYKQNNYSREISKNGYTLVRDFFSEDQLVKVKTSVSTFLSNNSVSHTQDGAQYVVKNIIDFNIFTDDEVDKLKDKILKVSQPYLGKIEKTSLHIYLHAVKRIDGIDSDDSDINLKMHSDTYHKTLKGFLYLEPLVNEDGPFEYVVGSNKIDRKRFFYEYECSSNPEILARDHGGWRFDSNFYSNKSSIKFTELSNVMIVADTFGLHRRNPRSKEGFRISIHFSLRKSPFNIFGKITG